MAQVPNAGDTNASSSDRVLVVPTRGLVLFPRATLPLTIDRERTALAVETVGEGGMLALFAQRDATVESPEAGDLHEVGTLARVVKIGTLEGNEDVRVALVQGEARVRPLMNVPAQPYAVSRMLTLEDVPPAEGIETRALARNVRELLAEVVEDAPNIPDKLVAFAQAVVSPGALTDLVAATLPDLTVEEQQELLATTNVRLRMLILSELLMKVRLEQGLRNKIRADVNQKLTEKQRELVLREQLETIQQELGEGDRQAQDADELERRLKEANLPGAAADSAQQALDRLRLIPPISPEYSLVRSYLDWLVVLPWNRCGASAVDLPRAAAILDSDHYDLAQVKNRILEHLAVLELRAESPGPILCFTGPPGVGKTSLGRSIAAATARQFVRIALGGCSDEAEIRGHRRTYVGAMPGQIMQNIRRAGTRDPVFMLDEVDKLGRDFRGDPASALLEVLDPEQNNTFRDRYLDVPFDLSKVMFICTANILDPIPAPLRDRMEVIELPGYVCEEKIEIARRFIVPQQIERHGMTIDEHVHFTDRAIDRMVTEYTREAGVRQLEQQIASVLRKRARQVVEGPGGVLEVTPEVVSELLGPPRYRITEQLEERTRIPGVAVALAWTPAGGEILFVEATRMPSSRPKFHITGQVKRVMEESAEAALSWLRAHAERYGISDEEFAHHDVHIHVPAGATPKDGPSAGIVMAASLLSLFTGTPVKPRVALSGEITLSGRLLPVGGIKAKVVAAKSSGVRELVLPAENESNVLDELPEPLRSGLEINFAETIDEAMERVFYRMPAHQARRAHLVPSVLYRTRSEWMR